MKITRNFKYFGLVLGLLACARVGNLMPPREDNLDNIKNYGPKNAGDVWYLQIQSAKNHPERLCLVLKELMGERKFPAPQILKIKSLEVCTYNDEEFEQLAEDIDNIPNWLKPRYVDHLHRMSIERNQFQWQVIYAFKKLDSIKTQKGKLDLLNETKRNINKFENTELKELLISQLQEKIFEIAPRFKPATDEKLFLAQAKDASIARDTKLAELFYEKILESKNFSLDEKFEAQDNLAYFYKNQRNQQAFLNALEKNLSSIKKEQKKNSKTYTKIYCDKSITYARSLWTKNRPDEARKIFLDLLKIEDLSEHQEAKVLSMLAKMCIEKKDFIGAQKYLNQVSEKKSIGADLARETLWLQSWQSYLNKQYDLAESGFKMCFEKSEDKTFSARCKFWYAKTLDILERNDEAKDIYSDLASRMPYDYYGIIAQRELKKPFLLVEKYSYDPNRQFDTQLEWLYIFDENELARNYLDQEVLKRKSSELKDLAGDYLPYFVKFKYYQGLLKYLSQIGISSDIQLTEKYFSFLYPLAYLDQILMSTSDPSLSLSIMRQESVFNTYARSPADAFGLMQIIPETAKVYAKNAKIKLNNFEELYIPEINIPIGVAILESNMKRFGRFLPAYVASYNADAGAVKNWLITRYDGDTLAFIENIPYSETQNYVKLVLRNYINYQRLISKNEFLFPEELFSPPTL